MSSSTNNSECREVQCTSLRCLTLVEGLQVRVFKSMDNLYDVTGARISVHLRQYSAGNVEVIINRSCDECKSFRKFGNQEICNKCSYAKGWLEDGCY